MVSEMRVVVGQLRELTDEAIQFAKQIGAGGVQLNTPNLPGEERWEYMDLLQAGLVPDDVKNSQEMQLAVQRKSSQEDRYWTMMSHLQASKDKVLDAITANLRA